MACINRHYYSFIKERTSSRWFEFNDSLVRDFDIADLDEETFGGLHRSHGPTSGRTSQNIKNAFMVIYDRVSNCNSSDQMVMNEDLRKMVHSSNLKFWKEKLIYNSEFFDFMKSLLSLPLLTEAHWKVNAFNCGLLFFFSILVQSGERDRLSQWSNHLANMVQGDVALGRIVLARFIEDINPAVREKILLKESSHTAVMRLLVTSIESSGTEHSSQSKELRAVCFKLSNILLEIIESVSRSGKSLVASTICPLPYLLYPLKSIFATQREVSTLLLRRKAPTILLTLFVFDSVIIDDYAMPNNELYVASSIQTGLIVSLASLFKELHYLRANGSEAPFFHDVLTIASTAAFTCSIIAQIKAIYGIKFAGSRAFAMDKLFDILRVVVWGSLPMTEVCLRHLLQVINGIDGPDLKDAFRYAGMLLRVDDDLTAERVNLIMTNLVAVMESASRYSTATEISIDMCLRLMRNNALVRKWVVGNWARCSWMESWLERRKSGSGPGSISKFVQIKKVTYPSVIALNKRNMDVSCNGFSSSPAVMLSVLKRFRVQEELTDNFYDSDDDPITLLGKRIEVKWAYNQYYTGEVAEYSFFDDEMAASFDYSADGLHRVVYDDDDVKWHNLAFKTWRFA